MALPPHLADLEGRLASRVDEALAGFRRAFEARLREATERLLAEATDVASPNVAGLLAEVESDALDAAPRREGARAAVVSLLGAARSFDRVATQADALAALVVAGCSAADRLALLLVRDDTLVAFESAGIDDSPERGTEIPFEGELRERLDATRGCLALGAEAAADACRQLGWSPNGPAVVVPLVLRDRIAALLWADRAGAPPDLAPLQLLTLMAAQRLELQALSARELTPTLFEEAEAPVAPLPLWSTAPEPAAPAIAVPAAATEVDEPQLDAAESFEIVGDESVAFALPLEPQVEPRIEPAAEAEPVPEAVSAAEPEIESTFELAPAAGRETAEAWAPVTGTVDTAPPETEAPMERVADELWTGSVTKPFDLAAFVPAPEPVAFEPAAPPLPIEPPVESPLESIAESVEPAPSGPTWELATLESEPQPGVPPTIELEPEDAEAAEAPPETGEIGEPAPFVAAPESAPEAPAAELDLLRTMRMPILEFPLAGAERQPEEATAAAEFEELSTTGQSATTLEFPVPEITPPTPEIAPPAVFAAPPEPDFTEDATVLTRRIPILPVAPPPAAPAEPAPSVTPFGTPIRPPAWAGAPAPVPPASPASVTEPIAEPIAPPASVQPVEDPMDRTASRHRSTEVAPPPDLQGPGRAFLGGRVQRAAAESPTHEEAKRLARLLISEIKLYNEEQVLEGRRNRDLYHRLKEDIDRSRQIYDERVDPAVRSGSDYFHQELVRSLAGGDPRALGI